MMSSLELLAQEINPADQMDSMIYFSFLIIIVIIGLVILGNYKYQRNNNYLTESQSLNQKKNKINFAQNIYIVIFLFISLLLFSLYLVIDRGWEMISYWGIFSFIILEILYSTFFNFTDVDQLNRETKGIIAQEIQTEDVLLYHDYDGIKELDNNLPSWWLYGFYGCVIFALFYLYDYHIAENSPLQAQEYEMEMKSASNEIAVHVEPVAVIQLTDVESIANGAQIYSNNCMPCHLEDGGGSIGPNLTDEYWLHGGDFEAIVKVINDGVLDKGMIAWKTVLSPKQINEVSSYLLTMPEVDGKDPQGELYITKE